MPKYWVRDPHATTPFPTIPTLWFLWSLWLVPAPCSYGRLGRVQHQARVLPFLCRTPWAVSMWPSDLMGKRPLFSSPPWFKHPFIHSFIWLFGRYILNPSNAPGSVLSSRDTIVNKQPLSSSLMELTGRLQMLQVPQREGKGAIQSW